MNFYCVELPYKADSAHFYAVLADLPWAIWLDSGGLSRYDILTAVPQRTLVQDASSRQSDPYAWIRRELGEKTEPVEGIPFAGGALGYWGYDSAKRVFGLKNNAFCPNELPDLEIGIYDWALVLDHKQHTAHVVSHQRFSETASLLQLILGRLQSNPQLPADDFRVLGDVSSSFSLSGYAQAFAQVQNYLQAGDCYQINLAQCFSAAATGDALGAYIELRSLCPAPYSAYLSFPQAKILCSSPERFLNVQKGIVSTMPIKGTRPRSNDPLQDKKYAEELRIHPKDRAENLMIVDLMRSDLSKSCLPGSVRTPRLFEVESYANVHHLVSTVEGRLADGHDALDVLQNCLPGGSVTGAPKKRAMQIINQLEPFPRGIYCGAIGYVGFDGNMDTNIAIRTMAYANNEIRFWAGSGIVADSEMAAEYQETLDKALPMFKLIRKYGKAT